MDAAPTTAAGAATAAGRGKRKKADADAEAETAPASAEPGMRIFRRVVCMCLAVYMYSCECSV